MQFISDIDPLDDHWRGRISDRHLQIHRMAEECMRQLGEQPMVGRTEIVCDAIYRGATILLEAEGPWLKKDP